MVSDRLSEIHVSLAEEEVLYMAQLKKLSTFPKVSIMELTLEWPRRVMLELAVLMVIS